MTLVVTEVSGLGIFLMGDSAGTITDDRGSRLVPGFAKIHSSDSPLIGFAGWGAASVGGEPLDEWLARFAATGVNPQLSVRDNAEVLANELAEGMQQGRDRPWSAFDRRGVHVAGYNGNNPELYHVHMGPEEGPRCAPQVERTLEFYPGYVNAGPAHFFTTIAVHLRNGIHAAFADAWERDAALPKLHDDDSSIVARVEHYRPIFKGLAYDTGAINHELSVLAFDWDGVKLDDRVSLNHPERPARFRLTDWAESLQFYVASVDFEVTRNASLITRRLR